jgi:hypothetical protein
MYQKFSVLRTATGDGKTGGAKIGNKNAGKPRHESAKNRIVHL